MKVEMTIISGPVLKKTLADMTETQAQLEELAEAQRKRDNESLWDKMKRVGKMPVYKKGE
mgnify:CR=1 FL=1